MKYYKCYYNNDIVLVKTNRKDFNFKHYQLSIIKEINYFTFLKEKRYHIVISFLED